LNSFSLTTPDGVEISADGKVGLACVTIEPAARTVTVDHAYHGEQEKEVDSASSLLASGMPEGFRIVLNGAVRTDLKTVKIDGMPAFVIPLTATSPVSETLVNRHRDARTALASPSR
jgi:hypothetical protein